MSAGDVVCTGWLIKSPPEKKLKRFTWRKRWFVLRRGRMSGNPDVLEYYQSKSSKKPIRTIDLRECEVQMQSGQLRIKREFHEKHLFVVKTSFRIFYLVAKTEEEMNSWIKSISQICQFMPLDDLHDSFSNSENSLEQKSSDDTDKDIIPSPVCTKSASFSFSHAGPFPSLVNHRGLINPPLSAPSTLMAVTSSSSPPLPPHCASSIFQFDKPYSSASFEATADRQTPPPLPPKPSHFSEQLNNEGAHRLQAMSAHQPFGHTLLIPSGISLSGLDRLGIGNLCPPIYILCSFVFRLLLQYHKLFCAGKSDDSYIPMASPVSVTAAASDGYIPMSPSTFTLLNSTCAAESSMISQATHQLAELAPPPINRHLKPRRRARPPPLDLRGLSSITHSTLSFSDHKVDYVQVDEKKTQALQNTKMEWKDVRQSKT
uniref:PH domain-containing protein n=1 Tax=Myripristis murdjan TaxID=586833 RepID=A0A667YMN9_9TELE